MGDNERSIINLSYELSHDVNKAIGHVVYTVKLRISVRGEHSSEGGDVTDNINCTMFRYLILPRSPPVHRLNQQDRQIGVMMWVFKQRFKPSKSTGL